MKDKMEINERMVRFYLTKVTNLWIIKNGVPADNLSAYDEYVEDIKRSAIYRNDLDALKLCFDKILADPGIDTGYLAESEYPWDDEEVREVIQYIWRKIWHNVPPNPN